MRTAGNVYLMVVHRCCAEDFVLPIGSFTKECGIFKLLAFTETDCGSAEVLINGIFGKRQCFQLLGKLLENIVTFVGNFGLARFALTGSDKYHTIGGAATVDGSGRSVLQNLHRYDVRWVDGTEYTTVTVIVTRYGYTVDDVERFVAVQELMPRILTEIPPPGVPEFCVTCTPAARPCKAWSSEVTTDFSVRHPSR